MSRLCKKTRPGARQSKVRRLVARRRLVPRFSYSPPPFRSQSSAAACMHKLPCKSEIGNSGAHRDQIALRVSGDQQNFSRRGSGKQEPRGPGSRPDWR